MRFDWRASAVAATAALVLSLLSGIIGGVTFGALVVRGIIAAVVFGAGAAGVSYVVDRYLPELKESMQGDKASGGASAEADGAAGSRVDIVVDDEVDTGGLSESDFELEEAEPAAASGGEAGEDHGAVAPVDAAPSGPADTAPEETQETGEEAVEELEPEDDRPAFTPGLAAERVHTAGADEEVAELEEAEGGADETGTRSAQPEGALDPRGEPEDLEEAAPEAASGGSLPDIEGFSGDFSEAPVNDDGDEESSEGSGEDPEMMARAIRTVLKREE